METGLALTSFKIRLLALGLAAAAWTACASDADILAARDAAQRGNLKALEAARARAAGHPLEAYPAYWLLSATLDKASPEEIRAFLAKNTDGPLADALRRDWLRNLGATQRWDLFRQEASALALDDTEIACYSLQERLARGDQEALREARGLWLAGREAPAACNAPFEAAARERLIGPPETWERIRKLLAAGLVKDAIRANAFLPNREQMNERALQRAAAEPAKYLAAEKSRIPSRATHELLLFAVTRLARSRPEDAAAQWKAHAAVLGPEDPRQGWARVAHAAAQQHHPRALEWYAEAGEGPFTVAQLQWKARAAIRAGDWAALRAAVNLMPPEEARESAWRYWLARALSAEGAKAAAEAILQPLARERHFYGLMAAEELGVAVVPDWTARPVAEEDLARIRAIPAVGRALELYRLEMNAEAFREWVFGLRAVDDRGLLAASEVALQAGLADRAIGAADRTTSVHDFARRYPVHHREALAAAARQWNVDEALLFGIIRQESRFNATAKSRVGATGLMQLMPATARWVAKQIPVQSYRPSLLVQPEVNVAMGAYYFHRVLADLGDPILATAGYNAGPGRARRWRDARPLEGAAYAESIPFDETRDYVKKVMANAWYYTHRLTGKTASLRAMMGTVPARNGNDASSVASLP
ncbi:MAG: lytic transglycosylase domain-containing protein [Betaproteobacteria bacterium]|nr:lytic transglycosylase domain-containing protein [Betaproteobacteria bacterium]